jgi:DNA-binding response OmpR family regulator
VASVPKQVLIVSSTESLRRTRELLFAEAGFGVVSVSGPRDLEHVCRRSRFDLAVVGALFEDTQKLRFAEIVRRYATGTPILEICRLSPVIPGADHILFSPEPMELVNAVRNLLLPAKKIAPEDPAARDEGPRLIPLAQRAPSGDLAFNARYLELADIALGEKKSKKRNPGPKN